MSDAALAEPVAVGVAEHAGWAFLISAGAGRGEPVVVDKRRVRLIADGVPTQPYHHETLSLPDQEAERLLSRVRRSIAASAALAFDHLVSDLQPRYRVCTIAMRQPTLEQLPASVKEAHASYYIQCRADAMLYHSAICDAARQREWEVVFHRRGEELQKAAEALQRTAEEVEEFLNSLRPTLRPPWAAEHRHAFAAAIAALRRTLAVR